MRLYHWSSYLLCLETLLKEIRYPQERVYRRNSLLDGFWEPELGFVMLDLNVSVPQCHRSREPSEFYAFDRSAWLQHANGGCPSE